MIRSAIRSALRPALRSAFGTYEVSTLRERLIASLFKTHEGAMFDVSVEGTRFTKSAGDVEAVSDGDNLRLLLDISQNLNLSEHSIWSDPPNFVGGSWADNGDNSYTYNGVDSGSDTLLYQSGHLEDKLFRIGFTASGVTSGSGLVRAFGNVNSTWDSNGEQERYLIIGNGNLGFSGISLNSGTTVADVSTQQVLGAHAQISPTGIYKTDGGVHYLQSSGTAQLTVGFVSSLGSNSTVSYVTADGITHLTGQTVGANYTPPIEDYHVLIIYDDVYTAEQLALVEEYLTAAVQVQHPMAASIPAGYFDTNTDSGAERVIQWKGADTKPFIIHVDTEATSSTATVSDSDQFILCTIGTGFSFDVDWGDGSGVESLTESDFTTFNGSDTGFGHTYAAPGEYTIAITGEFPRMRGGENTDHGKIIEIRDWGSHEWDEMWLTLSNTYRLELTERAVIIPPITPSVTRWHRFTQQCAAPRHPPYDVSSATMLDRMFYLADLETAPRLRTGACVNFHNFFRGCEFLEGPIPTYDISSAEDLYRFFRGCFLLTSDDIPSWATGHVRGMHMIVADCPLITRVPSTWAFDSIGEEFTPEYTTHAEQNNAVGMFASYTGDLGVSGSDAACSVADVSELNFSPLENIRSLFYRNAGATDISNIEFTSATIADQIFYGSVLETVDGLSFPALTSAFSMFEGCVDLVSATGLEFPVVTIASRLFANCTALTTLEITIPLATSISGMIDGCPLLSNVLLHGCRTTFHLTDRQMSRSSIMALIDSVADVTPSLRSMYLGGNPGYADLTSEDINAALDKGWVVSEYYAPEVADLGIEDFLPYINQSTLVNFPP